MFTELMTKIGFSMSCAIFAYAYTTDDLTLLKISAGLICAYLVIFLYKALDIEGPNE